MIKIAKSAFIKEKKKNHSEIFKTLQFEKILKLMIYKCCIQYILKWIVFIYLIFIKYINKIPFKI